MVYWLNGAVVSGSEFYLYRCPAAQWPSGSFVERVRGLVASRGLSHRVDLSLRPRLSPGPHPSLSLGRGLSLGLRVGPKLGHRLSRMLSLSLVVR